MQVRQETLVQSVGWEDPLEEGHGNPLQYSWLENPMDRGAWQATVPGVTETDTTVNMSVRACERSYFTTYYGCESVGRSPMTIYSSVSH